MNHAAFDKNSFIAAYHKFLRSKMRVADETGFDVSPDELHPSLKDHQRAAAIWALSLGRALIAMSFGLGKSRIQEEIARQVVKREGGKFLIICPLGVKHQFIHEDGPAMDMQWVYVRTDADAEAAGTPYLITNYERVRDGSITPEFLKTITGVSLDEGSVLRNMGSKTSDIFKKVFKDTRYKFVATATPSPNNRKENIYYAEWLGIADHGLSLTEFFKRTTGSAGSAGNLILMDSQKERFWLWISTWALFLSKPSDLEYSDEGYDLPEMRIHWHRMSVDYSRAWEQVDDRGQRRLIPNAANGISEAVQEKRGTMKDRVEKAREILAENPDHNWIIWHDLEDERRALEKAIPGLVTVYGSQDLDVREQRILDFSHGKIKLFATKPELAGAGCNFQYHCHSAIYTGIGYKFEDFIQSIHRLYRFMQSQPVDIHIIYAESEDDIVNVLKRKWREHDEQAATMQKIIREYKLSTAAIQQGLSRQFGVQRMEVQGKTFTAVNNDSILEAVNLPDNSIDAIGTSIPFSDHYEYTNQFEDLGHNHGNAGFFTQMDFLIPNLYRALKPGRVAVIHVKERVLYGHQTPHGFMEIDPFPDATVVAFKKHGFLYMGRRTIVTDVVQENNSTYRLAYGEMRRDASKMGNGLPETLLLFRKPPSSNKTARADTPVTKVKPSVIPTCPLCGYQTIPSDELVDPMIAEYDEDQDPAPNLDGKGTCPGCGERVVFDREFSKGYSLSRWQIDAHSLWRSNGNRPLAPKELVKLYPVPEQIADLFRQEQLTGRYDYERHVAICEELEKRGHLPKTFMLMPPKVTKSEKDWIWDDVVFMRTLNTTQAQNRKEKHICPLPFDIVERFIRLYSNEGDVWLDPFGGLGTTGDRAMRMGRRAILWELNRSYFTDLVMYCQSAEQQVTAPTLFDLAAFADLQPAD